jgi:hypothetical protein
VAATLALLAAAGVTVPAVTAASAAGRPSRAGEPANERTAAALAAHLLTLARLPAGATRVHKLPAGATDADISGAAPIPATPDLEVDHAYWTVPMAPSALVTWLTHHPPAGGTFAGQGTSSDDSGLEITDVEFTFAHPSGINEAGMAVSVGAQPVGGRAMVRVDTGATWLPPKPAAARVPPGVHAVTVEVGGEPTRGPIVPMAHGTGGTPDLPKGLTVPGPILLGPLTTAKAANVARLERVVDGLPVPLPGARSCPADFGVDLWVQFRAATGGPILATAVVDTSGCEGVALYRGRRFVADLTGGGQVITAVQQVFGVTVPRTGPANHPGANQP